MEIVFDTEESENLLIHLNNYLNLESTDDTEASIDEDESEGELELVNNDRESINDDS